MLKLQKLLLNEIKLNEIANQSFLSFDQRLKGCGLEHIKWTEKYGVEG